MAQIVTITNPLTGQPAQVDQLDHTAQEIDDSIGRALPGGEIDTLLAGKAPAGYGLGGNGTEVSDWNNARANGFYRDAQGTEAKHSPFVGIWSCGYVTNYSSGALVQVAFGFPFVNGKYAKCEKHRGYKNGGWEEWEWVNPPMYLGVEYRTTERYQGKPVYAKLVSFGVLPNNTSKSVAHGITELATVLYVNGTIGSGTLLADPNVSGITLDSTNITITTTADLGGFISYVMLKYFKYTD